MQFSVTIPESQVKKLEEAIGAQSTKQAIYQAVLRTTRAGTNVIRNRVRESLAVDAKYVNRVITTKVIGGELTSEGHIVVSHELIPLIGYMDRRVGKAGITVVITKNRLPLYLHHAFFATVGKGGHKGIFFRAKGRDESGGKVLKGVYKHLKVGRYEGGKLTKGGYARRLPMEEQFGPSIVDAIGAENLTEMGNEIVSDIAGILQKNIESQYNRFTGRTTVEAAAEVIANG